MVVGKYRKGANHHERYGKERAGDCMPRQEYGMIKTNQFRFYMDVFILEYPRSGMRVKG